MINEIYDTQSLNENQLFYFQTDFGQVIDINHWILRPHGSWNCDLTSFYRCDHISKPSTIITAYRVISAGSVFSWLALFLSNRWLKCFWTCSERRHWFSQSAVGAFKKDSYGTLWESLDFHCGVTFLPPTETLMWRRWREWRVWKTLFAYLEDILIESVFEEKMFGVYMFQILQNVSFLFVTIFNVYYPLMLKYNSLVTSL